jgi:hypothetical protein
MLLPVTRLQKTERLGAPLAGLLIAVYFFRLTRGSLHVFFSLDDTMNLYRSWSFPLPDLIRANLLFFKTSVFYRPMGSAWYRAIFHFAGFRAAPFHAANLLILGASIFLAYAVARRLSGSREIGVLTALLGCYHIEFGGLYFDTGFIYDVLCHFFYFSAFLLYLVLRQKGRPLGLLALAALAALYICALNSKEMALTLPLFLVLYEWIYGQPGGRSWRGALVTGTISLIFVIGRATGPDSLIQNVAYRPLFTWRRLVETSSGFLNMLFFLHNGFSGAWLLALWGALFALAWLAKSRPLMFAWLFLMLSPAPVAFVEPRGAAQYYIPLFGWVFYASIAIVQGSAWLAARLSARKDSWIPRLRAPLLFAAILLLLYSYYKPKGWDSIYSASHEAPVVQSVASQLDALHPAVPAGARLLFLNDPYDSTWTRWTMLFIVRLMYRDTSLVIDRVKDMERPPGAAEKAAYDHVFDYRDGKFIEAAGRSPASAR